MAPRNLARDLKRHLGEDRVADSLEERACYSFDSTFRTALPDVVVFPRTREEVQAVLVLAAREGVPVVPRGAGTGLSGGSVPLTGGIALVLTEMRRLKDINREDLVAVVEPGVVTGHLQAAVESQGLFYPPDPSSAATCTLGGNVAEGAGGPRGLKYGTTRHYVLGLEVVTAGGEVLRAGGHTIKDVAGYDLPRLFTGSEGTLGVITEITLRLVPRPPSSRTLMGVFRDVVEASAAVGRILAAGFLPCRLELMDDVTLTCVENYLHLGLPQEGAVLLVEVDGLEEQVRAEADLAARALEAGQALEVRVAADPAQAQELWRARNAVSPAVVQLRPTKISEDATVPRSQIPAFVRRVKDISRRYELPIAVFGHAGDGNLHPNILTDQRDAEEMRRVEAAVAELFQAALELGGTLSGEHGIGHLKAPFLRQQFGEVGMAYLRRLKECFDPLGLLNPHKVFPPGPEVKEGGGHGGGGLV